MIPPISGQSRFDRVPIGRRFTLQIDQDIVMRWDPYPTRTFPATDPDALTSMIPCYLQRRH